MSVNTVTLQVRTVAGAGGVEQRDVVALRRDVRVRRALLRPRAAAARRAARARPAPPARARREVLAPAAAHVAAALR